MDNLIKNLLTFCKYKYLLINKHKNKEVLSVSPTDKIDYDAKLIANTTLKDNNKYFIISVSSTTDVIEFCFIYVQNLTNKKLNILESQIEEVNKYISSKNNVFKSVLIISEPNDTTLMIKLSKFNLHKDQILNVTELCVNIKQFITMEIRALDNFNNHVKCLLYNNSYEINRDSQNTCLFTKLFFKVSDKNLQGLTYIYSNPVTGKQTEHRYYKY